MKMAAKGPKKKESKDVVGLAKDAAPLQANEDRFSARKKLPVSLWSEWNEQDIANEKWDSGKKEKDRGRSPTANLHYFDDPDGKIELPKSLKKCCKYWKRPIEILDDLTPVVVNAESLNDPCVDLISANDHLIDSELVRHIICAISNLYDICGMQCSEDDSIHNAPKAKPANLKDTKETKVDKNRKETDSTEDTVWKPWDLIWPKENAKICSLPICNPYGKYGVKLFWMGCFRKIIVDDSIPCDETMKPLLPFSFRKNELWPLLLSKALIKIASLDYDAGEKNSEIGEVNLIHCLTGWLPEPIPLEKPLREDVWNTLTKLLPNWKYPQPKPPKEDENKVLSADEENTELHAKESKDIKVKKEDKPSDKKQKSNDRNDQKSMKEKAPSAHHSHKIYNDPEVVVFASFANIYHPSRLLDMKDMADSSEKLRKFGLSNFFPHPVHINKLRNLPLIPPPTPVPIPRWKLIRQKKKKEIKEPACHHVRDKPPKFLEIKSPFFNYKFNPLQHSGNLSPSKWEKFKPTSPLESVCEDQPESGQIMDSSEKGEITGYNNSTNAIINQITSPVHDSIPEPDVTKRISISSNSVSPNKSNKRAKSSKEKKSILKDSKATVSHDMKQLPDINTSVADGSFINETNLSSDSHDGNLLGSLENKIKEQWIDFDDFIQCFQTLWIYHKPKSYKKLISESKIFLGKNSKSKKPSNMNLTPAGRNTLSPTASSAICTVSSLETTSPFLVIDCLKETEVVICFSSFSRWFDNDAKSFDGQEEQNGIVETPLPGTLIVEPYTWKKIMAPNPLMKICTTSVKAAVLSVKPGRHVMHLLMNAPLGYDVTLCSADDFTFGDENVIMQQLTNESYRFIDHGVSMLKSMGSVIHSFHSKEGEISKFLIGTENQDTDIREIHFETLCSEFFEIVKKRLDESFSDDVNFALKALKYHLYLHMKKFNAPMKPKKRPSSVKYIQRDISDHVVVDRLAKSLPNIRLAEETREEISATKIQATFRGHFERRLKNSSILGSKENVLVAENLQKIWNHVEPHLETIAVQLYRSIFKKHPFLFKFFPFHSDEWNKITYADYNGAFGEQPAGTWFLVCREIFHVAEPLLMTCKFYCPLSNCVLRVINNDTCTEIKTLFTNIVPQILHKNTHGYTFIALAFSGSNPSPAGKFRLRIIGDKPPLPYTLRESVNSGFSVKEIKDYFIPNFYKRIFRYTVRVTDDLLSTVIVKTSKKDVEIKLQVVENEKVIQSNTSKGEAFLQSVLFYRDRYVADEKKSSRPSSQTDSVRSSSKVNSSKRPPSSRRSFSPDKAKKKSQISVRSTAEDIEEDEVHKYIIEAYVLNDSWPLSKTEWKFIESLKAVHNNEEESESQAKVESSGGKNSAGKSRKNAGGKDSKTNRSRPESQIQNSIDGSKSHWELQCIVDSTMEQAIELKKDTEREDEIKAIKAAWESIEPGRAVKAQLSRQKFLESNMVLKSPVRTVDNMESAPNEEDSMNIQDDLKVEAPAEVTEGTSSPTDDGELYLKAPKKDTDIELRALDIKPFVRSTGRKIVLNDSQEEEMRSLRQLEFEKFYKMRDRVLNLREDDRVCRNLQKEKQLSEYEVLQAKLDDARNELQKARLTYRNKFVEHPEIEVHEAENADGKKRTPSPKRKVSKAVRSSSKVKKK